jgi:hypothetical protein
VVVQPDGYTQRYLDEWRAWCRRTGRVALVHEQTDFYWSLELLRQPAGTAGQHVLYFLNGYADASVDEVRAAASSGSTRLFHHTYRRSLRSCYRTPRTVRVVPCGETEVYLFDLEKYVPMTLAEAVAGSVRRR